MASMLLRPPEEAAVNGFGQDVALHRLKDVRAGFKRVGCWLHVQFCVKRVKLKHVMVVRPVCRSARTSVHSSRGANLIAAVRKLQTFWDAFRQACRRRWNVPDNPVRLIVAGFVPHHVHVVHVKHEALSAGGDICPRYSGRRALARRYPRSGLAELDRNLAAVRKS